MSKSKFIFAGCVIVIFFLAFRNGTKPYVFPELTLFPKMPVNALNPLTVEGADLGRHLFYDPVLSSDSSVSCSSCHKQEYAFSDALNLFSKGIQGQLQTRNTLPLFNLAWHPAFFSDGRVSSLEDQISHPLLAKNEMNSNWIDLLKKLNRNVGYRKKFEEIYGPSVIDSTKVKYVLAQFLRTLVSHESEFDKILAGKRKLKEAELKGLQVMSSQNRGDCLHCHPVDGSALVTTFNFSNNGLDSIYVATAYKDKGRGGVTGKNSDNGKFMIPSLRNILLTAPYMHDGRFKTIEEVLEFYSTGVHLSANIDPKMGFANQKGVKLTQEEKKNIIAFLTTLTDSIFISKKEFSDPFSKK